MAIINGRRIDPSRLPPQGVHGSDLQSEIGATRGRRPVIRRQGNFETIDTTRNYKPHELLDKKGQGVKVSTIPDRSKGATFGGQRSELSRRIVTEQVVDIAEHLFTGGLSFDEDHANWMMVSDYRLPRNWHDIAHTSDLLIAFPTEYPQIPPIGFYLMADLPSPHGHLFNSAYHGAWEDPIRKGWRWYCCNIEPNNWKPTPVRRTGDWRHGDNLWTYFTLINEVLGAPG